MPTLRSRSLASCAADEEATPKLPVSWASSFEPVTPALDREVVVAGQDPARPQPRGGSRRRKIFAKLPELPGHGAAESARRISKRLKASEGEVVEADSAAVAQMENVDKGKRKLAENDAIVDKGKRKLEENDSDNATILAKGRRKAEENDWDNATIVDKGKRKVEEDNAAGEEDGEPAVEIGSDSDDGSQLDPCVLGENVLGRQPAHQLNASRRTSLNSSRNGVGSRDIRRELAAGGVIRPRGQNMEELRAVGNAEGGSERFADVQSNVAGVGSSGTANVSAEEAALERIRRVLEEDDEDIDGPFPSASAQVPAKGPAVGSGRSKRGGPSGNVTEVAKARFLEIARRRAAHFAHFAGEVDEAAAATLDAAAVASVQEQKNRASELLAQVSAETGQRTEEREDWPGPWSTAMRLVEGRAAAAAARLDPARASKEKPEPLVEWSPSRQPNFRQNREATSLHDMCIDTLCANVEHVESLGGVPDVIKNRISARLCSRRSMTATAFRLFFDGAPVEVSVPDCSLITEENFSEIIARCSTQRLQVLDLGMCGRGLSDQLVAATLATSANSLPNLNTIILRGAYRLSNNGLTTLLRASPQLTKLDLIHCNLMSEAAVHAVADSIGPQLISFSLESCSQLDALKILPSLLKMSSLQTLSLSGVSGMSNGIVSELAAVLGPTLQELALAECRALTDEAIAAVSLCCCKLQLLDLGNIPLLTDVAIGRLADGCRSLKTLRLNRGKFSDSAVAALVTASGQQLCELSLNSVRQAGDLTISALAKYSRETLEQMDVSWCRRISDQALGFLADSCFSLRELRLFGCTQVTNLFLKGHSNRNLIVIGLSENLTSHTPHQSESACQSSLKHPAGELQGSERVCT